MGANETFQITVSPSVVRTEVVSGDVDVGCTLAQLGAGDCVLAWVDGQLCDDLDYVPQGGQSVALKVIPAGGGGQGKSPMRLAATLALLYVSNGIAAGSIGSFGAYSGYVAAATSLAGSLAINALIPPPEQNLDQAQGLDPFQLSNTNLAKPFGVIPRLYGKHRVYPPMAGRPYTEQAGSDQYVRLLFCLGYGPLTIDRDSFRLGDTPITQFEGQYEIREGAVGDLPLTLYSQNIAENNVGFEFAIDGDTRTEPTEDNCQLISIDIACPSLFYTNRDGATHGASVGFKIEVSPYGAGAWTTLTKLNAECTGGLYSPNYPVNPNGGGNVFDSDGDADIEGGRTGVPCFYLEGYGPEYVVMNIEYTPPAPGRFEVRVTRIGAYERYPMPNLADHDWDAHKIVEPHDRSYTEAHWQSLRSAGGSVTQNVPEGFAFVAMRIKRTGQISGSINNFNCVATSRLPVWNGSDYVEEETSNPAWIYREILSGENGWNVVAVRRPPADPSVHKMQL